MNTLPFLIDAEEAIDFYIANNPNLTDAEKAYVVRILAGDGFTNRSIRESLGIEHVYTVTHLKRAGTLLSEEELQLWHNNASRITLGHVRAVAKLAPAVREDLLRGLLLTKTPVSKFEALAKGEATKDIDTQRYERLMGESIGREVRVRYSPSKRSGLLQLEFYSLDDLDHISRLLGFDSSSHI